MVVEGVGVVVVPDQPLPQPPLYQQMEQELPELLSNREVEAQVDHLLPDRR